MRRHGLAFATRPSGTARSRPVEAPDAFLNGRLPCPRRSLEFVLAKADDPDGGFDLVFFLSPKDQRRMDRFILFALVATARPLQAAWTRTLASVSTATVIASGAWEAVTVEAVRTTDQRGFRRLSPFTYRPFSQISRPSYSIRFAFKGPMARRSRLAPRACRRSAMAHASFEFGETDVAFAVARKPASIS